MDILTIYLSGYYERKESALTFIADLRSKPHFVFDLPRTGPVRLTPAQEGTETRRRKLWDLSPTLHCSIIGTCLSTSELRRIVGKATAQPADKLSDHDVHKIGVAMSSDPAKGAKILHKALDSRHAAIVKRLGTASGCAEVRRLWEEARAKGEIPGAYWAVLTHPAAGEELARDVFGAVHMLSHLVGAANRADIRRLADLEAVNAALEEKVLRQQEQLRRSNSARDQEIAQLRGLLAGKQASDGGHEIAEEQTVVETQDGHRLAERLQRQLATQSMRRAEAESLCERLRTELAAATRQLHEQEGLGRRLTQELAGIEAFVASAQALPETEADAASLCGAMLLYVGGRTHSVAQLHSAAARRGAQLLHHDGGQQEAMSLLPALIARAEKVFFPVDCVSHDAALAVKRLCKQADKPYIPLPSSGLGSFLNALAARS
jgi:hypothetical protein